MAPVASDFPNHASWVGSFVLKGILIIQLPEGETALAFALIRRAEGAIEDYEAARAHLADFVKSDLNISLYFRGLRKLESTLAMVSQALKFIRKALEIKLFTQGDGTPYERLNVIYNKSRHADPEALLSGHLHAVWIKNDGLYAEGANLTFDELRDLICGIGRIAGELAEGEVPRRESSS